MLTLSDFDFELPPELIAQFPIAQRSASRLLNVTAQALVDQGINDLPDLLMPGDLMVFNDTRVLKARFFGQKESGGKVEVLAERQLDANRVLARVRASKSPAPGTRLRLADAFDVNVLGREGEFYVLHFPKDFSSLGEEYGHLPLPPYISRTADSVDETRYQTVYAAQPGAIAAPTAGLHFDEPLLARLRDKGINMAYLTLHVGAGTFQPVRTENLAEHIMHSETYEIPQKTVEAIAQTRARGNKVIAVGTTSLRALESAARSGDLQAGTQETRLFITPGYRFRVVDRLLTNFHLPKSTLLMLVSAFAGYAQIRHAYAHAVQQAYRFFSYGDAMLLNHHPE